MHCFPAQQAESLLRTGHQICGITGPPVYIFHFKVHACNGLGLVCHLLHAYAVAGAQVHSQTLPVLDKVLGGFKVSGGQVGDMDIVPYAGSVWCRIVVSEYGEPVPDSSCSLHDYREQVGRVPLKPLDSPFAVVTGCIEIP